MSIAYDEVIEQQERGWSSYDSYVCESCVRNPSLKIFISENSVHGECNYCSQRGKVVEFDALMHRIFDRISEEWTDPNNDQPWESGFVFEKFFLGPEELLYEVGLDCNDDLFSDIYESINRDLWSPVDFFRGNLSQLMGWSWERLVRTIKHRYRYFHTEVPNEDDEQNSENDSFIPSWVILKLMGEAIERHGLLVNAEVTLFRARVHERSLELTRAVELGTPEAELCVHSNRMSAAGIPMFYGALHPKTAVSEIYRKGWRNRAVSIGKFQSDRSLRLIDFTRLPKELDFFEPSSSSYHEKVFLRKLISDLSGKVSRDGREHLDYVPTQIVTEYLRYMFQPSTGLPVDGILYPSATDASGVSCAIFAEARDCVDSGSVGRGILRLRDSRKFLTGQFRLGELKLF